MQTVLSNKEGTVHGNCFWTCIASVTHIPLSEFEDYQNEKNWFPLLWDKLIKYEFEYHGGINNLEKILDYKKGIDGYYVVDGESPRGFVRGHSVVFKDGKMVHDPHPENLGLSKIWRAHMIERINNDL